MHEASSTTFPSDLFRCGPLREGATHSVGKVLPPQLIVTVNILTDLNIFSLIPYAIISQSRVTIIPHHIKYNSQNAG